MRRRDAGGCQRGTHTIRTAYPRKRTVHTQTHSAARQKVRQKGKGAGSRRKRIWPFPPFPSSASPLNRTARANAFIHRAAATAGGPWCIGAALRRRGCPWVSRRCMACPPSRGSALAGWRCSSAAPRVQAVFAVAAAQPCPTRAVRAFAQLLTHLLAG